MAEVVVVEVLPRHPRVVRRERVGRVRGVHERHVHRLLGAPHVGRVGDEQRHRRRTRPRTRPRSRATAAAAPGRRAGSARAASAAARRRAHQPLPGGLRPAASAARSRARPPAARQRHQRGRAEHRPRAVRHEADRPGHPHQPADEQQAERLGEPEAGAGQAAEHERGQRRGRQADHLDQREEAERFEHARRLVLREASRLSAMSTYERVADLPLKIDGYALDGLVKAGVERLRARLDDRDPHPGRRRGGRGRGRHLRRRTSTRRSRSAARSSRSPASGRSTASPSTSAGSTCSRPARRDAPVFRNYRRWAFESAALDLALRQAGTLAGRRGRARAASRCASWSPRGWATRRRIEPVTRRLARYPDLRFKLDGTPDWDDDLIDGLVAHRRRRLDRLQGRCTRARPSTRRPTPGFYRRIAEAFPDAWLEDPDLEPEDAREALRPFEDRITWDAPIHSIDDILAMPVLPRTVNLKPSRFGSVRALFDAYDFCEERGMGAYGGGQYELGVGPRADPVPGGALPCRRAQRHRSRRLRRARPRARAARQPARARARAHRLPPAV